MVRAIIFDFAGVIGMDGYWSWLKENVRDLERHVDDFHEISNRADRGEVTAADFMNFVGSRSGMDPDIVLQQVLSRIIINQPLIDFIRTLKTSYKIGLLSNFVFEWLDPILRQNDLYPLFDSTVISSQVRMIKPEPEIFELACTKLNVLPSEAIFVDDRQMHVDGANRVGLRGVLFRNVETLKLDIHPLLG